MISRTLYESFRFVQVSGPLSVRNLTVAGKAGASAGLAADYSPCT